MMTEAIDQLLSSDQQLFLYLNSAHTPLLDTFMYYFTNKYTWIPMYGWLLYQLVKTYGKTGWFYALAMVSAVLLADFITSGAMKPYFARPRPCHDPIIGHLVHLVGSCGGKYGFASSHASTSFALVTTLYLLTKERLSWIKWLFIWPLMYSYSRVYVGVHYTGDIFVGAFVGLLAGYVIVKILKINKIAKIIV